MAQKLRQPYVVMSSARIIQQSHLGYPWQTRQIEYNQNAAACLGIAQMAIGIFCFSFNVALIGDLPYFHRIGYGIWSGTAFFLAGLLGYLSGRGLPNKRLIASTAVLGIVATCCSLLVFFFGALDAVLANDYKMECKASEAHLTLTTIMVALAMLEAIVSIISSTLCCRAVACCNGVPTGTCHPYSLAINRQAACPKNDPRITRHNISFGVENRSMDLQYDRVASPPSREPF